MKVKITEEKKNTVFSRTELTLDVEFEGATPSRTDLTLHVAKDKKADKANVLVKSIDNTFGVNAAKVLVYIYDSVEVMKKVETKIPEIKEPEPEPEPEAPAEEAKEEAPAAEEAPAEEAKEEAPAEEKKEE